MILCQCKCRYLLSIDPGLMTGMCLIDLSDPDTPVVVWSVELTIIQFWTVIEGYIDRDDVHIVIERFVITEETAKKSEAPWSMELIGNVKFLCWKYSRECDLQSPSQKTFATNDKLRAVDFWHVGGDGHANDALRHAMIWIVEHNRKWTRKLLV